MDFRTMGRPMPPSAAPGRVPRDWRFLRRRAGLLALGLLAGAAVLVATGFLVDFETRAGAWIGGVSCAAAIAAMVACFALRFDVAHAATVFAGLEGGAKVAGDWIVDPTTWREAMATRPRPAGADGRPLATVELPDVAPEGGMEIVVTDDAAFVGDLGWMPLPMLDLQQLRRRGRWLEFVFCEDDASALVVPIARDGEAAADALVARLTSRAAAAGGAL